MIQSAGQPFITHLAAVIGLAERAGAAIARHYARASNAAERKGDGSPVTAADLASDAILRAGLETLTPAIPVISEETAPSGGTTVGDGPFWCVDPLDGTKEYLARTDEFCVCVGGVAGGRAVFGVLHAPLLDLTFATSADGAIGRFPGAAFRDIRCRPAPTEPVALASRRSSGGPKLEAWLTAEGVVRRRVMGSAVKFGLLAAGEADVYARFGPTSEWDTAAGHAILEAAGGSVTDLDGAPLRYGKPGFANPSFIARGGPADRARTSPTPTP